MEVYGAVYNQQLQEVHPIVAEILHNESFSFQSEVNYMLIGSGAAKSISFFDSKPNVAIDEQFSISAIGLVEPSFKAYQESAFEDVAYFEPFYLKDFVSPHFKPEN
jgi:tRNA threonylcarbamoyladenosine biosynthesis protein TsaB